MYSNLLLQNGQHSGASRSIDHLSRAINTLRLIDSNNRIVERCTDYVQYLLKVHLHSGQKAVVTQGEGEQFKDVLLPQPPESLSGMGGLPDLNDFLKDDLELAQFFASGIFDMQNSMEGFTSAF